jgi:hypothetical protein
MRFRLSVKREPAVQFAWFPVKLKSGDYVWLERYWTVDKSEGSYE